MTRPPASWVMVVALAVAALLSTSSWAFVQGPAPPSQPLGARASSGFLQHQSAPSSLPEDAPASQQGFMSWVAPLLGLGCTLGLVVGLLAPVPARAITAEQFSQLTYAQVKG
eukprot:CAMPEP_0197885288 /NCGR_PEP_ID=MMETSP1439-20131203/13045_1 /TAXON_ID=66791 /ORGANISM="Gonyaulax spinifera, Strain CCMP409" /LENGTH=111 /DNA_ID=CAMNT_0043505043 /DNA_START=42 /DNA_END=373 /DNA_ORIENTATION=+